MIALESIYDSANRELHLWELLQEREPTQNISHKAMPNVDNHARFIASRPYEAWYFIRLHGVGFVGACYLTKQNEIGVQVFKNCQGKGYGKAAVEAIMSLHGPRRYLANINPANERSAKMFQGLGFKLVQHTYARDSA